tara:strand:- start:95 stop:322 length:228 start_codon:yes stop_codon:yes gene_type:complete
MIINVDGKQSKVTRVIEGREAAMAQIYPDHLQLHIDNASGVQMPVSAWEHLKNGGAVTVSGRRYSDLKKQGENND